MELLYEGKIIEFEVSKRKTKMAYREWQVNRDKKFENSEKTSN